MKYRYLGRSGVRVSELCLGAMTFGEADDKSFMHKVSADEKTSFQLMSTALERGVNFWDTADVYGQDGLSERTIGKWFKETNKRDQVVLATKCRFGMGPGPNDKGASRLHASSGRSRHRCKGSAPIVYRSFCKSISKTCTRRKKRSRARSTSS